MVRKIAYVVYLFVSIHFIFIDKAEAQYFDIGISGGLSSYSGELSDGFPSPGSNSDIAFGVNLGFHTNENFMLFFQYSKMSFEYADNSMTHESPTEIEFNSFEANIDQLGLIGRYQFFPIDFRDVDPFQFTPFIQGGLAMNFFNPRSVRTGSLEANTELLFNPETALSVPLGVGFNLSLGSTWYLTLVGSYDLMSSDLIDGTELESGNDATTTIRLGVTKSLFNYTRKYNGVRL